MAAVARVKIEGWCCRHNTQKMMSNQQPTPEPISLDDDSGTVTLISHDGKSHVVRRDFVVISDHVKTALECSDDVDEITLSDKVSAESLASIVKYMVAHRGVDGPEIPKPLVSADMKVVLDSIGADAEESADMKAVPDFKQPKQSAETNAWDVAFITELAEPSRQPLYDMIVASLYMGITGLSHLAMATTASLIKDRPLADITEILAKGTEWEGQQRPHPYHRLHKDNIERRRLYRKAKFAADHAPDDSKKQAALVAAELEEAKGVNMSVEDLRAYKIDLEDKRAADIKEAEEAEKAEEAEESEESEESEGAEEAEEGSEEDKE